MTVTWEKVVISEDGEKEIVLRYVLKRDSIRLDGVGVRSKKK